MRRSEMLSLTWSDIDETAGIAKLPDTKNGSSRMVPLSNAAISILENLPKDEFRVFATTEYAIRHGWDRLVARTGIDDLKFHDLRHEAISRFFEIGLTIGEVGKISGHKDIRMLYKYTHGNLNRIKSLL